MHLEASSTFPFSHFLKAKSHSAPLDVPNALVANDHSSLKLSVITPGKCWTSNATCTASVTGDKVCPTSELYEGFWVKGHGVVVCLDLDIETWMFGTKMKVIYCYYFLNWWTYCNSGQWVYTQCYSNMLSLQPQANKPASTAFTVILCQPAVSRSKILPSVMPPESGSIWKIISWSVVRSMENLYQRRKWEKKEKQ